MLDVSNPRPDLVRVEYAIDLTVTRMRIDERKNAERAADVIARTGVNGSSFPVVATTGEPDAGEVVDDVTAEFGGGGGSIVTQGGGLDETPATVIEYLRKQA